MLNIVKQMIRRLKISSVLTISLQRAQAHRQGLFYGTVIVTVLTSQPSPQGLSVPQAQRNCPWAIYEALTEGQAVDSPPHHTQKLRQTT